MKPCIKSLLTVLPLSVIVGCYIAYIALPLLHITGCHSAYHDQKPAINNLSETGQKEVIKWQTRYETTTKNLTTVQCVLVIGAVGALIACFMGAAKFGAPVFAACLIGYGLLSAGIYYPRWVALFGLVGGVLACGYAIWINRRAFRQVVLSVETAKTNDKSWDGFKEEANAVQSETTQKMVKAIKEKTK